ncbi:MAG: glycosyltransferase [Methanolobus sp.]
MKLLACEENILDPPGGGELSFETLLRHICKNNDLILIGKKTSRNHKSMFQIRSFLVLETNTHMFNKFWVFKQVEHYVKKYIVEHKPDLVITQQDYAAPTVKIASKYGIPTVVFMRNYEHFCLCANPEKNCSRKCAECYGYSRLNPYRYFVDTVFSYEKKWLKKASLVISNSYYMSEAVKEWLSLDSFVIYPFINKPNVEHHRPEYITMISPSKHKGIEVFLEIADKMPDRSFLVVGNNPDKIDFSKYDNVKYLPWVNDPAQVYSKTKILLVPSIWPEPFGRVCIEAAFCGIPSIASNNGGLPEAVGEGGMVINDYKNPEEWINAIKLLDDEDIYHGYSDKAKTHAMDFEISMVVSEFRDLIKNQLGLVI